MTSTSDSRKRLIRAKGVRRFLAAGTLLWLGAVTASAEASDPAAARTLFAEARKLATQGNYAQACPKFEESMRLDNGIGTRFNLADCWEQIGRTASAWSLFLDVAAGAKSSGQRDREKVARERAARLEGKLSRLTIRVSSANEGLEVRKNDTLVGRAQWGTATPVDPGSYVIEARAAGKKSWKTTITVAAGTPETAVVVPELEVTATKEPAVAAKSPPPETRAQPQDAKPSPTSDVAPDAEQGANGLRTAGWVVGAAGVVGVGVGVAFAIMTKSADNKAAALCTGGPAGNECADEFERLDYERNKAIAQNRATVAYVGLIGGGAAIVTSAILLIATRSSSSPSSRGDRLPAVTPVVGSGMWGVEWSGAW